MRTSILFLLAWVSIAQAQFVPFGFLGTNGTAAAGGGGADVAKEVVSGTANSDRHYGGLGPDDWVAGSFTASNSYTLHRLDVKLFKTGSPTWTMKAYIYADLTNSPNGGLLGTASANLSASTVTGTSAGTASLVSFTSMSVSITSGTKYWAVLGSSGSPHDFANYVSWQDFGGSATDFIYQSSDGSSWGAPVDTFERFIFTTYGQ